MNLERIEKYVKQCLWICYKCIKVDVSIPGKLLYEGIIDGGQGATKITFTFKVIDLLLCKETSTQEPELILNTLPFVVHGASSLPLVDDTHPDGE